MTKRLIKEAAKHSDKGEFFHSSGYARAQQGARIGAAGSGQTFKERQKMVRAFVGKYDDAQLAREAAGRRQSNAKKFAAETGEATEAGVGTQRWADMKAARAQRMQNGGAGRTGGARVAKK